MAAATRVLMNPFNGIERVVEKGDIVWLKKLCLYYRVIVVLGLEIIACALIGEWF